MRVLKKANAILELGRISNLPTVWSNVLAAWWICGGGPWMNFMWLLVGASAIYVAGTTLNDAMDVEFDRKFRKERAIPSGVVSLKFVWALGIFWLLSGIILLAAGGCASGWILALVAAILIYDWIHKRSVIGVFFMGSCRTFLWLGVGSAALAGEGAAVPWAIALGLYIVGLSFTARGESRPGKRARWPLLLLFSPLLWSLSQGWGGLEWGFVFGAGVWICFALRKLASGQKDRIGKSVSAMLAGIVLIDAVAVSTVDNRVALALLLLFPLALGFQRWIPAT